MGKNPENMILVTIDCLRKDKLGCYGSTNGLTPNIDTIASDSVVCDNYYTAIGETDPSLASYFTSKYPFEHGLRLVGEIFDVSRNIPVATLLRKKYNTVGFPGVEHLNGYFHFNEGFNEYYDHLPYYTTLRKVGINRRYNLLNLLRKMHIIGKKNRHSIDGNTLNARVKKWLSRNKENSFFMWIHYFDIHRRNNDAPDKHEEYNRALSYQDKIIGELYNILERYADMDETLMILTADHGEMLGEHGYYLHRGTVYQPEINIPLIVRYPNLLKRNRIKNIIRSIDIAPTLLDFAGIEKPKTFRGRSLLPIFSGGELEDPPAYMESYYFDKKGLRVGKWKLIVNGKNYVKKPKKIVIGDELYDLDKDPEEKTNLIDSEIEVARKIKKQLIKMLEPYDEQHKNYDDFDEERKEMLRALGYLD